jgi:hypothetical protein
LHFVGSKPALDLNLRLAEFEHRGRGTRKQPAFRERLDRESVEITVACRYQACDDVACGLPIAIEMKLVLPLQTLVEPEGIKRYVERLE